MSLTPIDLQKISFKRSLSGYDRNEVENLLQALTEELADHLNEIDKLERENRYYKQRLQDAQRREGQLQEALVQVHKVADQVRTNAEKEGELVVAEAHRQADQIVARALEEASRVEGRVHELRSARSELELRFRQTLEYFQRVVDAEQQREMGATVHTLPRRGTAQSETA